MARGVAEPHAVISKPTEPSAAMALAPELFESVVARFPDALALEIPGGAGRPRFTATYAELEARSRALGHELAARLTQLTPDELEPVVALFMDRTCPGLLALQLACLRIGAPYLAIDPSLPDDHARFLIEDAGARLVCADTSGAERARRLARDVPLFVGDWRAGVCNAPDSKDAFAWDRAPLRPNRLAYLIYTSGTTGRPKCVEVEHHSLANLVHGDLATFDLGPGDRVAQGSSPSYDSSLEEVWMALATGATVVVLDAETTRSGPDLIPWLRAERISVLCPPPTLLRTTGCLDPSSALPELRLVYVGGEALPPDLAAAWGGSEVCPSDRNPSGDPGGRLGTPWRLRLVNGYGPTECTVTVLRSEVRDPGDIRIGTAIPGAAAFVLTPDGDDVPDGADGELWIAGKSLARGYRGRPDLTAERFPRHPLHGRCYRTGDLVRAGADGELYYLGRIDDQVQLRGHRVELGAVEARLCELDEVGGAACCVRQVGGRDLLVAFLVAAEPGAQLDLAALRTRLVELLPEPMVPARLEQVQAVPTSVGGKLDRARLPALSVGETLAGTGARASAGTSAERAIGLAFAEALGLPHAPEVAADFFHDLGGDSLAAALLVSALRRDHATARLAVRDVYLAPTTRALARRAAELRATPDSASAHERCAGESASRPTQAGADQRFLFTLGQVAWMGLELLVATLVVRFAVFDLGAQLLARVAPLWILGLFVPAAFGLALLWLPLSVGLTVVSQRLLLGRYRPGRFAAFGGWHLRHWVVTRLARRIPWGLVRGTRGTSLVLRALGAQVGRAVHLHRGVDLASGGWSLLGIGSGVALEQDAALRLVDLDGGELVVGAVTLGAGASVAVRAGLGPDSSLGAGARLEALSYLESGTHVAPGERWGGTPARCLGRVEEPEVAEAGSACVRGDVGILCGGLLVAWLLSLPLVAVVALGFAGLGGGAAENLVAHGLFAPSGAWFGWCVFGALLSIALVLDLLAMAVLVRLLGRRVAAAGWRFPIHGGAFSPFVALWLATGLVERAGTWLSGSLFWPPWLRLAGMRIGSGAEISTVIDVLPRDVRIGPESFFADGVYLAGAQLAFGQALRGATHVGRDTFVGNHAVIPAGAQLPDDVLIGVCTVADQLVKSGAWFGQPPFELPRFPAPDFDRTLTHEPGLVRRLNRLAWEATRLVLPAVGLGLVFLWFFVADRLADDLGRASLSSHLALGAATLVAGANALVGLLALKWALLGRVRAGKHPLWSCWCSRWDFLYVAWGFLARPALAVFDGCLLQSVLLRLFGMRIGPGVLLGGAFAQVVDPDMLHFGAGATVAGIFQAHTFEDRVLKIAPLEIGPGATLGAGALAFYGVRLEAGSRARPHGVALKGETLAAGRDYAGVPLVPRTWD